MHVDKAVRMKEIARPAQMNEEEQVGLLREDYEDLGSSRASTDEEDTFTEKPVKPQSSRRRWIKSCVVVLLAVCAVMLVAHWYRTSQTQTTAPSSTQPRLRPEDDYILDPTWDFNASPTTREYSWIIEDHELNPDGVHRPMMLINSTFPGPLIQVNEHDEIVVHVHNRAANATSIHWHGLYQNSTNHMDGTVGVTNCPVAPGHSFTYRFNVTGQSGTYWYHSHVSMQASDGLVGPLVIHSRNEKDLQKVPYEQDRVVLLADHYYDASPELLMQYLAPGSDNDEPVPPSALINGRNVRNCTMLPGRKCATQGLRSALFDLSPKETTRLRFVNVGAFAEFSLQIDEHEFSVTEVDGTDVLPQSIHRLNISPAQRYSVVLSPPVEPRKKGYWMRARMVTHCFAYENPELEEEVWGVVHYDAGEDVENQEVLRPQSRDWPEVIEVECRDLNTTALQPVEVVRAPGKADDFIFLRSSFQIGDWRLSRAFLNESSWRGNATRPVLHSLLDAGPASQTAPAAGFDTTTFDSKTHMVYTTRGVRTIDILLQNLDDGNHPFHLHGYKFWVLKHGKGYAPQPASSPSLYDSIDLSNPLRRDTATIEPYGWMLIRFVADNPGAWAFHCHIGWHNEAGLGMVFATRADEMLAVPAEVSELCGLDGVEKGMGPEDSFWYGKFEDRGQ
ncbi:multicopper oxidase [Didymella exigua CBS 183.55]|uniref:Multicopper oxidase n=1 Tax=Didymella exigua CBS 183.55 TaxID=1150837 RepID=A0A6A5S9I0_9PLEO|nr:multicopper oxidase [Didymella exigua CBS 183.55]KAF1934127.1 multicopper oxidase [Didymella exigua CBS 183.55]